MSLRRTIFVIALGTIASAAIRTVIVYVNAETRNAVPQIPVPLNPTTSNWTSETDPLALKYFEQQLLKTGQRRLHEMEQYQEVERLLREQNKSR
jgi:hypothetical protein